MTERLHFHFSRSCIGDRNGHPLQCSCLENPRDSGAWWAAIYGLTQSRTQLSDLAAAAELTVSLRDTGLVARLTNRLAVEMFKQQSILSVKGFGSAFNSCSDG